MFNRKCIWYHLILCISCLEIQNQGQPPTSYDQPREYGPLKPNISFQNAFEESVFFAGVHYLGLIPREGQTPAEQNQILSRLQNKIKEQSKGDIFSNTIEGIYQWELESLSYPILEVHNTDVLNLIKAVILSEILSRLHSGFIIADRQNFFFSFPGQPDWIKEELAPEKFKNLELLNFMDDKILGAPDWPFSASNGDIITANERPLKSPLRLQWCPDTPSACLLHLTQHSTGVHSIMYHSLKGLKFIKLFPAFSQINHENFFELAIAAPLTSSLPLERWSYKTYQDLSLFLRQIQLLNESASVIRILPELFKQERLAPITNISFDMPPSEWRRPIPQWFDQLILTNLNQSTNYFPRAQSFITCEPRNNIYYIDENLYLKLKLRLNPSLRKLDFFISQFSNEELSWKLIRTQDLFQTQELEFNHLLPLEDEQKVRYLRIIGYTQNQEISDSLNLYVLTPKTTCTHCSSNQAK